MGRQRAFFLDTQEREVAGRSGCQFVMRRSTCRFARFPSMRPLIAVGSRLVGSNRSRFPEGFGGRNHYRRHRSRMEHSRATPGMA